MKTAQFTMTGNIGHDVKVNKFENSSKAYFSLAVNETNKDGEKQPTEWFDIVAWRSNDKAHEFDKLKKGQLVKISGYIKNEKFSDKNGVEQKKISLIATVWDTYQKKEDLIND